MSEPFLAEIKIFGFNFPPRSWAFCDGQILPIAQNQSLYSLLGTTYGGDGRTSFALPDLRGRAPGHVGNGHQQGQKTGEERHTLSAAEMPQHTHSLRASDNNATEIEAGGNVLANTTQTALNAYAGPANLQNMGTETVVNAGGGQSHQNMQPYLALSFCIALRGLFPSRN
ncbi:MAG: tail fiber protein [Kiloniellales bacterium]|nr:tail fiber protein [Kiloniellales bacterium]